MSKDSLLINIKSLTIIKILLILVLFAFLFIIRDILAILFISVILASAVDPSVDWMKRRGLPRALGIMFIYIVIILVISFAVYLIIPPIIEQTNDLMQRFPQISDKISSGFEILKRYSTKDELFKLFSSKNGYPEFAQTIGGVFSKVSDFFGGVVSFFLVMVITFYMVVEENAMKKIVWSIAPRKHQIYVMNLVNRMQQKIGLWLRGQLILSFIIFLLTYVGLLTLGLFGEPVKYALILALIAGLTEFVPYLGPLLAAIPAVFLAFTQSWVLGISVGVLYYVIQLCENHIIVPKLMQRVVGLNPIISIVVLLIGFRIGGIAGAILSIPVTTALSVFVDDVFAKKEADDVKMN